ncbi:probable ATP-dependent helicase PF08_0048 [Polyodon spathula]|uniref:probable ATP-dependent helicase PF08_0048 n=1 Tax=Polyodon spathula TaxID=7913 RepID=UPI001B7ECA27|nr:probable ATP-dependent helicase PF08_0048 [Polyodon spathula]
MDTNCSNGTFQDSPDVIPRKWYRSNNGAQISNHNRLETPVKSTYDAEDKYVQVGEKNINLSGLKRRLCNTTIDKLSDNLSVTNKVECSEDCNISLTDASDQGKHCSNRNETPFYELKGKPRVILPEGDVKDQTVLGKEKDKHVFEKSEDDVCLNKERCNEETEESSQEDIIHTKRKSRQVIYDTEESCSDTKCDKAQESNSDLLNGCNRIQETCSEYSFNSKKENTSVKSSEEDIIPIKHKRVNVMHDTESDSEEEFDKMKQTGLRMNTHNTGEKYVGEKTVSLESELSNTITTDNNDCAADNKMKTVQNTKETTEEMNSSQEDEIMFVRRKCCRRLIITDSESSSLDTEDSITTAFDGNDNVDDNNDDGVEEYNENQENSEENSQESTSEEDFFTDGDSSQENLQSAEIRELLSQNGVPVYYGFEAHFHRIVQALITDAVKGNFLADVLYGRGKIKTDLKRDACDRGLPNGTISSHSSMH